MVYTFLVCDQFKATDDNNLHEEKSLGGLTRKDRDILLLTRGTKLQNMVQDPLLKLRDECFTDAMGLMDMRDRDEINFDDEFMTPKDRVMRNSGLIRKNFAQSEDEGITLNNNYEAAERDDNRTTIEKVFDKDGSYKRGVEIFEA